MNKIPAQHNITHPPGQHCSEPIGKTIEEYKIDWEIDKAFKRGYNAGFAAGVDHRTLPKVNPYFELGSEAER